MKAMGNRIKEQRQKLGLTLEEVAERVNRSKSVHVSKSTLSKLENGLLKYPHRPLIDELAKIFDCDPICLLGYNNSENVTLTYSAPGQEQVTLLAKGKPIIGEAGLRAKLYKAALDVAPENITVAIELLNSLSKGGDTDV